MRAFSFVAICIVAGTYFCSASSVEAQVTLEKDHVFEFTNANGDKRQFIIEEVGTPADGIVPISGTISSKYPQTFQGPFRGWYVAAGAPQWLTMSAYSTTGGQTCCPTASGYMQVDPQDVDKVIASLATRDDVGNSSEAQTTYEYGPE